MGKPTKEEIDDLIEALGAEVGYPSYEAINCIQSLAAERDELVSKLAHTRYTCQIADRQFERERERLSAENERLREAVIPAKESLEYLINAVASPGHDLEYDGLVEDRIALAGLVAAVAKALRAACMAANAADPNDPQAVLRALAVEAHDLDGAICELKNEGGQR